MKLVKTMKKLKFWSKNKKKKKTTSAHIPNHHHPPPSSTCHCYHSWDPVPPSAPPSLSMSEYDQQANSTVGPPGSGPASSSQAENFTQPEQEIVPQLNSLYPQIQPVIINTSYQHYMTPNPMYGVPVVAEVRREKVSGFFGCVVNIGRVLIRCFCPCFHSRSELI